MDKQAMLEELRRVGDDFRRVEKTIVGLKNLLAEFGFDGSISGQSGGHVDLQLCPTDAPRPTKA